MLEFLYNVTRAYFISFARSLIRPLKVMSRRLKASVPWRQELQLLSNGAPSQLEGRTLACLVTTRAPCEHRRTRIADITRYRLDAIKVPGSHKMVDEKRSDQQNQRCKYLEDKHGLKVGERTSDERTRMSPEVALMSRRNLGQSSNPQNCNRLSAVAEIVFVK